MYCITVKELKIEDALQFCNLKRMSAVEVQLRMDTIGPIVAPNTHTHTQKTNQ
jgi:hypothetical protein